MKESQFNYAPPQVKEEFCDLMGEIEEISGGMTKEDWSHFTPQFLDTHSSGGIDTREILDDAKKGQAIALKEKLPQPEATVKIATSLPITVFFFGDIHMGSNYTNMDAWEEMRQHVLNTPGEYLCFMHNLVDNAIPSQYPHNMLSNGMPPARQFLFMQTEIKELDEAGKVLGAVFNDCHEGWSFKHTGVPADALLYGYSGRKFPVLENGGVLTLGVGSEIYQGCLCINKAHSNLILIPNTP